MFRKMLQKAITNCGGKQENLAEALGISPGTLSKKINGESGFHEDEITKIMEISGGCKRCKAYMNKRLTAYNEVLKSQLEYIGELEQKIHKDGDYPFFMKVGE